MAKNLQRIIKPINYFYVFLIVLGVIAITLYLFQDVYFSRVPTKESALSQIVYEIQYDELTSVFVETSDDYFLYISYLDDNNAYRLERNVKKIIIDYDLQSNFYYLNATDLRSNTNFIDELNAKLKLENNEISYLPAVIYYQDGQIAEIVASKKNSLFSVSDLKKVIKKYGFEN